MEPRLLSRGYRRTAITGRDHHLRFNGATTSQPWIQLPAEPSMLTLKLLQWSHDFSAVDTSGRRLGMQLAFRASMEPRLLSRGYILPPGEVGDILRLQWSHDFSAVDTISIWISDVRQCELQWSHDFSAVDTRAMRFRSRLNGMLQWSHDFSAVDTTTSPSCAAATRTLQWSHDFSAVDTTARLKRQNDIDTLQWSHDFSAVDTRPASIGAAR